jgi:hypothetical protein
LSMIVNILPTVTLARISSIINNSHLSKNLLSHAHHSKRESGKLKKKTLECSLHAEPEPMARVQAKPPGGPRFRVQGVHSYMYTHFSVPVTVTVQLQEKQNPAGGEPRSQMYAYTSHVHALVYFKPIHASIINIQTPARQTRGSRTGHNARQG